MTYRTLLFALALAATMTACGDSGNPMQPTPPPAPAPTPAPPPAPTPSPNPTPPSGAQQVTIGRGAQGQGSQAYGMNPLTIATGTTVTWANNDNVPHTATSNSSGVFNTGVIDPGQSASFTFNTPGTVAYHCTLHPGMTGTIVVQ